MCYRQSLTLRQAFGLGVGVVGGPGPPIERSGVRCAWGAPLLLNTHINPFYAATPSRLHKPTTWRDALVSGARPPRRPLNWGRNLGVGGALVPAAATRRCPGAIPGAAPLKKFRVPARTPFSWSWVWSLWTHSQWLAQFAIATRIHVAQTCTRTYGYAATY